MNKQATTVEDRVKTEIACPDCGEEISAMAYEEGPEMDTLWIFEKASIGFSHYGRGAGLSFKFHESLNIPEDADPVKHFEIGFLIDEGIENKTLGSFQEDA